MNPQDNQDQGLGLPVASNVPILAPPVPVYAVGQDGTSSTQPGQPQQAAQTSQDIPAEAADTDVIEKEWVTKVRSVVASTRDDPYAQVQEINKLKAEYMMKRYNKEIKLADT